MSKPMVISRSDGTRVPFLRGILIRSLQDAGLTFDQAFQIATIVRESMEKGSEITEEDLRNRVVAQLESFDAQIVGRYKAANVESQTVLIRLEDGATAPFSRGQHRIDFESCGMTIDESTALAQTVYDDLQQRPDAPIEVQELRHMIHSSMEEMAGAEAARRYVAWVEFQKSDRPLMVFLGGTPGTGKSSIASQLAHRLEIVRTQSTDMLREVMRMMIPKRLLPVLHTSSFNAWKDVPGGPGSRADLDEALASGYLAQTELLSVAAEAVIQRTLQERVSLILEGVHVHPHLLETIPHDQDAIVVPMLLAVLDRQVLQSRIMGRGRLVPARRARRYLQHFDDIWRLQTFLLSEADRTGIHIVPNEDKDKTGRRVMGTIVDAIAREFSGSPDQVFR